MANPTYLVIVPYMDDMGSVQSFRVSDTAHESKAQAALWTINKMREHDNLPALARMPNGTRYERVK